LSGCIRKYSARLLRGRVSIPLNIRPLLSLLKLVLPPTLLVFLVVVMSLLARSYLSRLLNLVCVRCAEARSKLRLLNLRLVRNFLRIHRLLRVRRVRLAASRMAVSRVV
jgi:hypothetical protein